jgi:hypothetical protein
MEAKAKLTKEMLCEEARFILANILAEGRYGKQNRFDHIRRICEGAVSVALPDYISFLESFGYLVYDRESDVLDVTADGERVVSGDRTPELMSRVVQHFGTRGGVQVPAAAARRARAAAAQRALDGDSDDATTAGPNRAGAGEILDRRYEKLERLGAGGIGTVWKARQVTLDREVALKEIREVFGYFTDEQRREIVRRFGEVVRQAARLAHPNILPLLDVNADREFPYLVMELAPHGNLRRIIDHAEEVPISLAIKYFVQTLHALRAAHDQGVIHRGLKPENILLDRYGNALVSDFGLARVAERDPILIKQVYVGMGTIAYMAPELYADPLAVGPQTDLYALGIILYELLARRLPGRRSPMPSTVCKGLPSAIDDIFDKLTRDDRNERYKSTEEVLDDFYRSAEIGAIADIKGLLPFFKSPLETLKFKDVPAVAAAPEGTPTSPATQSIAAAEGAVAATPPDAPAAAEAAGAPVIVEAVKAEREGGRSLGRRPYSFQQRLKDREKSDS